MNPLHGSPLGSETTTAPNRTADGRSSGSGTAIRRATTAPRSTSRRSVPRTRRAVLALVGTAATGLAGCLDDDTGTAYGWREADSPVEGTLYDVAMSANGPYAVGEDGRVVARRSDRWEVVVEDGPGGAANRLSGAAVTDDGRHVWFAGDSGAVGKRDVREREGTDYSAPQEKTSIWEAIDAVGTGGSERVYLLNGSGELLSGTNRGGDVEWGEVVEPAGDVAPTAIGFAGGAGFISDSNGGVLRTTDGDEWTRIGVPGEDATLTDVAPLDSDTANAVTGEGAILVYTGSNWIRLDVGQDGFQAIDREGDRGFVVGTNGAVYELDDTDWTREDAPTSRTLYGTTLGTADYAGVAVGGNGTILERFH